MICHIISLFYIIYIQQYFPNYFYINYSPSTLLLISLISLFLLFQPSPLTPSSTNQPYQTFSVPQQLIQFNLNMDYSEQSISKYLTEDCKDAVKKPEKCQSVNLPYQGRWSPQQWALYVSFSLLQICKRSQSRQIINSFAVGRRVYCSYDRKFVQFLKIHKFIDELTPEQEQRLIKRAKSKFNTLKRRYKQMLSSKPSKRNQPIDFSQMIYFEAKKILEVSDDETLMQAVELFEAQRAQGQHVKGKTGIKEVGTDDKLITRSIKTRLLSNKRKQFGIEQN